MSSLDIIPREDFERRLAAILVADVVGYSRLMQADEEGTLSRLEEIGASIIDPRVAAHRGHIFRTMGDGLLIEFPSVVEAVLCAAEIQEELRLRGEADPPEHRIQLRIGINIGDVIRKGNDVFGTGVNIAARLESLAEPGTIYISGEAYDQVRDRPFAFDDLGMKAVKNIARLVRVYRVRPGEVTRTSARAAHWFPQSWRLRAAAAGSFIGLAIIVAALVLRLPATLTKTTSSATQPIPTTEAPLGSDEMSAWAKIKSSDKIDEFASFLDRFPNSRYSEYIRHRLNALRAHPSITKFRDCPQCPEMVVIPPGSFTMGVPQNELDRYEFPVENRAPLHSVRIARPFALGEFLVTRKEYAIFAEETEHTGLGCFALPVNGISWKFDAARSWNDPGFPQADDHPVVCVSWNDAIAYVGWLSRKTGQTYRLPSEAEWEYAGRAGGTSGRYFGDAPICEFANVRDQSKKKLYSTGQFFGECNGGFSNTSPVGSFPPNGFGLYDMLGNAYEWVEDCRSSYLDLLFGRALDAPVDGTAYEPVACNARVLRGASWNTDRRYKYNLGSRLGFLQEVRGDIYGFRIARDYPAPASVPSESPTIAQAARPATSSPQSPDWAGTWVGSWDHQIAAKIIISEGNVLEYDYSGHPVQRLGQTTISGDTFTFGTQPGSVITLTKQAPFIAAAHYHGPSGDADAVLVRQEAVSSPGAPQSSDWDGTWFGAWGGEVPAKIVISGDNVLEYDNNGNPNRSLGQTIISGNTLTFGTPPGFVITLTKRGPTTAAAHYHGPSGEADGELVRQ
jgi:formylglycine-generating enzyme required for sulfatase activity/class 3 adenylate cyclase